MSRFEEASQVAIDLVERVKNKWFAELVNAPIAVLFDCKRRGSKSRAVFARIATVAEVGRILSANKLNRQEGWAYVMILDKALFLRLEEADRTRIIRHELCHCLVDYDKKGEPVYKTVSHDIEDFHAEVERNQDDPDWRERCFNIWLSAFDKKGKPLPLPDPNQPGMFEEPPAAKASGAANDLTAVAQAIETWRQESGAEADAVPKPIHLQEYLGGRAVSQKIINKAAKLAPQVAKLAPKPGSSIDSVSIEAGGNVVTFKQPNKKAAR